MSDKALLVMAKHPRAGRSKTRLAPVMTAKEAAELYTCFLRDSLNLARAVAGVTPYVAYAPPDAAAEAYFRELAPDFKLVPQHGKTLGDRLASVMGQAQQDGFAQVAAMNSDGPTLPPAYLAEAFIRLDDPATDVVLGPCEDGGYYLIGWKRPHPRLVRNVQMSTDHVLSDTLALAKEEELTVSLLPPWYDVDTVEDLQRVLADLVESSGGAVHTRRFLAEYAPLAQQE